MAGSVSKTSRYILRRTGSAALPGAVGLPELLKTVNKVKVLDATPRMMLVDGPLDALQKAVDTHEGWELVPETLTPLPDTRPKLRKQ